MTLNKILDFKRERIDLAKRSAPVRKLRNLADGKKNDRRDLLKRLSADEEGKANIIAEFKRASPSKGVIVRDVTPEEFFGIYEASGAAAISVLTEQDFFKGSIDDLTSARSATKLPVLRKDFIIDEYQIYESASCSADAALLIVKILEISVLKDFYQLALEYNIVPLVEIHSLQELDVAMKLSPGLIGINNRNLETLKVDINTTERLVTLIPDGITVVSESGISSPETIRKFKKLGIDAFLVGEALLTAGDSGKKLRELVGI